MPDVMVEQTALAGVKLCTKEADASMAVMEARLHLVNGGFLPETVETVIELLDADGEAAAVDRRRVSVYGNDEAELTARIYISNPKLWDTDRPNLYTVLSYSPRLGFSRFLSCPA